MYDYKRTIRYILTSIRTEVQDSNMEGGVAFGYIRLFGLSCATLNPGVGKLREVRHAYLYWVLRVE